PTRRSSDLVMPCFRLFSCSPLLCGSAPAGLREPSRYPDLLEAVRHLQTDLPGRRRVDGPGHAVVVERAAVRIGTRTAATKGRALVLVRQIVDEEVYIKIADIEADTPVEVL